MTRKGSQVRVLYGPLYGPPYPENPWSEGFRIFGSEPGALIRPGAHGRSVGFFRHSRRSRAEIGGTGSTVSKCRTNTRE
jgi:hypothetical protein